MLGQSWAHLWYLYLMIGLYLMMPFYRMIAAHADSRDIRVLIGIFVIFISILPMSEFFITDADTGAGLETGFYIATTIIYPCYLFIGHYIFTHDTDLRFEIAGVIISTALIAAISLAGSTDTDPLHDYSVFFGYNSILVIVQSSCLFALARRIHFASGRIITDLDRCSFGIYLIHMIFIWYVIRVQEIDLYSYGPLMFAAVAAAGFLMSFIVTWLLIRIPAVRRVL